MQRYNIYWHSYMKSELSKLADEFFKLADDNLQVDDWVVLKKKPYALFQIKSLVPMGSQMFYKIAPYDSIRGRTWRTVLYKDQTQADYSHWMKKHNKSLDEMDQSTDEYTEEHGGWDTFEWMKPMSVPGDSLEKVKAP